MEKEAFSVLKSLEGTWWHVGRSEAVKQALNAVKRYRADRVLDVGAGFGSMYPVLSAYGVVDATEPNEDAARECMERGYASFYANEIDAIKASLQYGIIGAFDVIEHVEDDVSFVKHLYELTEKGGVLVATVPAFQWLWSEHDVSHQHYRRHTIASMRRLLEGAGYSIEYVRHWNVFFFPVVAFLRLLGKTGESGLHPRPIMNRILTKLILIEPIIMRLLPLPFGLSIVIVAKKIK